MNRIVKTKKVTKKVNLSIKKIKKKLYFFTSLPYSVFTKYKGKENNMAEKEVKTKKWLNQKLKKLKKRRRTSWQR